MRYAPPHGYIFSRLDCLSKAPSNYWGLFICAIFKFPPSRFLHRNQNPEAPNSGFFIEANMKKVKLANLMCNFQARLFILSKFSILRMFYIFLTVLFFEQLLSIGVEYLLFGQRIHHWFDPVFTGVLFAFYIYFSNELGKLLLLLDKDGYVIVNNGSGKCEDNPTPRNYAD